LSSLKLFSRGMHCASAALFDAVVTFIPLYEPCSIQTHGWNVCERHLG
jgi:hypothetical protein